MYLQFHIITATSAIIIFSLYHTVIRIYPVAAGTGGADGQCPPKTNCKIRITINIKIVI
jgi:hypothetical protein